MIPWLRGDTPFPTVELALAEPNGLLCAGGDLSPGRLLEAYRHGIFPWYSGDEPILWWSPDPRMVLFTAEFKVSRSLAKSVRNKGYVLRVDSSFGAVLESCAAPRKDQAGTWLGEPMREAYLRLHRAGHAHSFETWKDGELVGGLYGIAIGRMFFGESMFSRATDASKVALVGLVHHLRRHAFPMIDCQMNTRLLASLGAREIPRAEFSHRLTQLVNSTAVSAAWSEDDAARDAEWGEG
jgi:leucyl/phenylalanyl-tRNA--protein transferase